MAIAPCITYATDAAVILHAKGFLPNATFAHRFGNGQMKDSFFDPTPYADVKLKCTNLAAGGAGAVVLQQLRR